MGYSPFFSVLHDEQTPVGSIGRGAHYSVLRAPIWHNQTLKPLTEASVLDFAVIWDEDHDTRVFDAIHEMYFRGTLSLVLFVGERKGTLNVVVSDSTYAELGGELSTCRDTIHDIAQSLPDPWPAWVDRIDGRENNIVHTTGERSSIYLRNIEMLWSLGIKPWHKAVPVTGLAAH